MSFTLPPFFQQYISPATAGQTSPPLGENKSFVAPQVRSGSASATPQEPTRFGGLDFSALPKKLVPDTSLPKQRLNLLA
jgi:hypothetical protein